MKKINYTYIYEYINICVRGYYLHNMYVNTALWGIHWIFAKFLILMLKKIPIVLFTKKENINRD